MLYVIESTSCRPRLPLLTLFTSSTLQCCMISNKHHVDIAYLLLPSLTLWTPQYCTISIEHFVNILYLKQHLHRSHRWHCNVVWYRINIMSTLLTSKYLVYIVYIVDIAMLYDIDSTSCRRRSHHRHRNLVRCRINIVSTKFTSCIAKSIKSSSVLKMFWPLFLQIHHTRTLV